VEPTEQGDHYDPVARRVRLSPSVYGGRSLTAVTVAAHEVGLLLIRDYCSKPCQKTQRGGGLNDQVQHVTHQVWCCHDSLLSPPLC